MPRLAEQSLWGLAGLAINLEIAGLVMHYFGEWRRRKSHQPSTLATFAGGMCFAIDASATRLAMLHL